jgi:nuclear pore complex protein Nup155
MSSKDPADIEDHARESLRLFKKVPFLLVDETHGRNKLQGICKDYMNLKFFPGNVLDRFWLVLCSADPHICSY